MGLFLGVELVRRGARESFTNTISQTDLIVGARGGTIPLLLYTVFHLGTATNNISHAAYQKINAHPAVQWTIPYSFGDSHRGFRVIGTSEAFYREFRYRQAQSLTFLHGHAPRDVFDVVLGYEVARTLKYQVGTALVLAHGLSLGSSFLEHKNKPFRVVGILQKTTTPIDRALYIPLEGMTAMHLDWQEGAPPRSGQELSADDARKAALTPDQITAFLLRTKSRIDTLRLQREINTLAEEPLMAIIPGVALAELWQGVSYAEDALRIITFLVLLVGLLGMLIALSTALNERRREIAILRALGAGPKRILTLLMLESGVLGLVGSGLGILFLYGLLFAFQPLVAQHFGLYLPILLPTTSDYGYLTVVLMSSLLIGLIPAVRAYHHALVDGLAVRL